MVSTNHESSSKFAAVNNIKIHYRELSSAGSPLLFLHGVTSSLKTWDGIAHQFASDYQVISIDLRGHGKSENPGSGYSWEMDYAEDITQFISQTMH